MEVQGSHRARRSLTIVQGHRVGPIHLARIPSRDGLETLVQQCFNGTDRVGGMNQDIRIIHAPSSRIRVGAVSHQGCTLEDHGVDAQRRQRGPGPPRRLEDQRARQPLSTVDGLQVGHEVRRKQATANLTIPGNGQSFETVQTQQPHGLARIFGRRGVAESEQSDNEFSAHGGKSTRPPAPARGGAPLPRPAAPHGAAGRPRSRQPLPMATRAPKTHAD